MTDIMFYRELVGYISLIAYITAAVFSLGHAWFYFDQRKRQTVPFMRGLACRMKFLFLSVFLLLACGVMASIGMIFRFPVELWVALGAIKAVSCVGFVATQFWLFSFYRRPHV